MTVLPRRGRSVVAACAIAGGLAVPLHPVATPAAVVVGGLLGVLGLQVWRWSGLAGRLPGTPRPWPGRLAELALWWGLGLLIGLVLILVIRTAIEPVLPSMGARMEAAGRLPVWRRLLIIYVAAVAEELVFRLLLMSFFVGSMVRLLGQRNRGPSTGVVWSANLAAALLFAGAHLPAWAGAAHLTTGLVLSVMALNGIPGLIIGSVFAKRGIVAAMWLHAGADCAVQLLGPLLR